MQDDDGIWGLAADPERGTGEEGGGGHSERTSNYGTEPTRRACASAIALGELAS